MTDLQRLELQTTVNEQLLAPDPITGDPFQEFHYDSLKIIGAFWPSVAGFIDRIQSWTGNDNRIICTDLINLIFYLSFRVNLRTDDFPTPNEFFEMQDENGRIIFSYDENN